MINQFIYARTETGYSQLNDLTESGFSEADLVSFQDLWMYNLTENTDWDHLPECRFFYNMATNNGMTAVIGKTSFVPAGTCRLSGNRDTTCLHKYLLTGTERESLLKDVHQIFEVTNFCMTAESSAYILEANTTGEEKSPVAVEETENLLLKFGIGKEQVPSFLYEILDTFGNANGRVYITLPKCTKEYTDDALKLCERILAVLPRFMVVNCGFLTYTIGFHSAANKIPTGIKLVFIPKNNENRQRYHTISENSHLIDPEAGYLPDYKIDHRIALDIITHMSEALLTGKEDTQYRDLIEKVGEMLEEGAVCTLEEFCCAYEFCKMEEECRQGEEIPTSYQYFEYILKTIMASETLHNPKGDAMVIRFLREYLMNQEIEDSTTLNYLCTYCSCMPETRKEIGRYLSSYLSEHREEQQYFERLLGYEYAGIQLSAILYDVIYTEEGYYSLANIIEQMNYGQMMAACEDDFERIQKVMDRVRSMAEKVPDYVKDEDTVAIVNIILTQILDSARINGQSSYTVAAAISREVRKLAADIPACSQYEANAVSLAGRELQKLQGEQNIPDVILKQLEGWSENEDEPYFGELSDYGDLMEEIRDQIRRMKLRELLEKEAGDESIDYLNAIYGEEAGIEILRNLYNWHEIEKQKILNRIIFQDYDKQIQFYADIWLALYLPEYVDVHALYCRIIMGNSKGGIAFFSDIWDYLFEYIQNHLEVYQMKKRFYGYQKPYGKKAKKMEEEWLERAILNAPPSEQLRQAVGNRFQHMEIDGGLIKEMKKNIQFVEDMHLEHYIEENSMAYKIKGLTGRIKKN